jgi:hypothetical protein
MEENKLNKVKKPVWLFIGPHMLVFKVPVSDANVYITFRVSYRDNLKTYLHEMHSMLVAIGPICIGSRSDWCPLSLSFVTKNYSYDSYAFLD